MDIQISEIKKNQTVAVALSGGSDSVFLLYRLLEESKKHGFNVVCINVEHGIRGEDSLKDTEFVKKLAEKLKVKLYVYSVSAPEFAKKNKMTLEQAARVLRYNCFFDAINSGKCDKVATAHHLRDNVESVLFNLFRGAGSSGAKGILPNFEDKIIRPMLSVKKEQIEQYLRDKNIDFVTDKSNFNSDFTRNFIRLELLPKIKEIFPQVETSISRFSEIAREDDQFICDYAKERIIKNRETVKITLPLHPAVLKRASIIALKSLGIKKDWEKSHLDAINSLACQENGKMVYLKKGIRAVKEYDGIVFYLNKNAPKEEKPFSIGETILDDLNIKVEYKTPTDLKSGLFADAEKIPSTAVFRFFRSGDTFTKFGGGTKSLSDFFTDKKIPARIRKTIPLVADGKKVLVIFNVAISEKIKVDKNTINTIQFTYRSTNE